MFLSTVISQFDELERRDISVLLRSELFRRLVKLHTEQFSVQLINLDATRDTFVTDFRVAQANLRMWQELAQVIQQFDLESKNQQETDYDHSSAF